MNNSMIKLDDIEPMALEIMPEIWEEYLSELGILEPEVLPISREQWIQTLYQLPVPKREEFESFDEWYAKWNEVNNPSNSRVARRLGATIVFDNLVVYFLVDRLQKGDTKRLESLFDWIEALASNENEEIRRSIIQVTLGESLISNHARYFKQFFPYIEKRPYLHQTLIDNLPRFRVDEEIKALLLA